MSMRAGSPTLGESSQWRALHRSSPSLQDGVKGYLEGPGEICSSVGEVSMIRTSSRSM